MHVLIPTLLLAVVQHPAPGSRSPAPPAPGTKAGGAAPKVKILKAAPKPAGAKPAGAKPAGAKPEGSKAEGSKPARKAPAAAAPGAAVKQAGPASAPKPAAPALKMGFTPSELDLAPGEKYRVELVVPSPTGKAFEGALGYTPGKGLSVTPDSRWTGKVPPWGVKTYPVIAAAPDAEGELQVTAALEKGGSAALTVRVARPQIEPVPGYMLLTVKVTNPFRTRLMKGRIIASNPDRFLEDVTTREFRIEPGQTADVVFPLPGAAAAEGEKYDFTLAVETYDGYRDRKTYPLEFPSQPEKPL